MVKSVLICVFIISFGVNLSSTCNHKGFKINKLIRNYKQKSNKPQADYRFIGDMQKAAPAIPLPGDLDEFVEEIETRPHSPVIFKDTSPLVTELGTWTDWWYCTGNNFFYELEYDIHRLRATLEDKNFSWDSEGLSGLLVKCKNLTSPKNPDASQHPSEYSGDYAQFGVKNRSRPTSCDPFVARGIQLRHVPYVGCQDDYGAVNIKVFCARNQENEKIAYDGIGKNLGEWTRELICPPASAICGFRVSDSVISEGTYINNCYNYDGTGIDGISIACCRIDEPAAECHPTPYWENRIAICGPETCPVTLREGMFYLPTEPSGLPEQYEYLGFAKLKVVETLLANFEGTIGEKFEDTYEFWTLLNKESIAQRQTQKFQSDCKNLSVEQLILECGFYQVRTKHFRCKRK